MNDALRIVLPVYLLTFFVIAFAWRSYLVWKRTGINPYVVGRSERPIDFVENLYPIPTVVIAVITTVYAIAPGWYWIATPIVWLDLVYVKVAGLALMGAALLWTATAQIHMGSSWRIGIDPANKTELVGKGLFGISRNPVFVGMRSALWGFFLTLPSAFSLAAVVMADVLIQVQVRIEEEFLRGVHGEAYAGYRSRVRRWL